MIITGIVLCFSLALAECRAEKKIFNPLTIFMVLWGIILFLSDLQLYRLYHASTITYGLINVGISTFALGYYCTKVIVGNKIIVFNEKKRRLRNVSYKLRYKLIYILIIFSIPFYLKDLFSIFSSLSGKVNLGSIQAVLQNNDNVFIRSSIENAIRLLVVNPISWVCIPVTIVDFWLGKRDKKLIILTIIMIFLRILTTGGRAAFIQLAFYFVSVFTLTKNKKLLNFSKQECKKHIRDKKKFLLILMLAVFVLVGMTYSRAGQNALKTIYYDFAMQPVMFEIWANKVDMAQVVGFGVASLNGFLYPLDYILRNILGIALPETYQSINELIMLTDTSWQWIGNGVCANAYVSAFWFLYVDGRIIGIAIGMFIYGIVARISYKNAVKTQSPRDMSVYSIILIGIFYTFGRLQFAQYTYVLGLLYMSLFVYKKKYVMKDKLEN